ncbi:hypothetical protein ABZX77_08035 [Streptomyces sp. NPDC004237]|uniref:hypothetical protein n=1 Tax=Streptomyces sp. NPDC004237 TaxID=3154455 RepID=UPI0033B0FFC6
MAGGVDGLLERYGDGYLNPRLLVRARLKPAAASGARLLNGQVTAVDRNPSPGGRGGHRLLRATTAAGAAVQARAEQAVAARSGRRPREPGRCLPAVMCTLIPGPDVPLPVVVRVLVERG